MKKMISLVIVCVLTLAMVTGLTSCTSSNTETTGKKAAVCYVLANTACSQAVR